MSILVLGHVSFIRLFVSPRNHILTPHCFVLWSVWHSLYAHHWQSSTTFSLSCRLQ